MPLKNVAVEASIKDGFTIETKARSHTLYIDQPEAGGGKDAGPTPLEYLFFSLAGCIATIGKIMAKQRGIDLRGMDVKVEGNLDTAILMGKSNDGRPGFRDIKVIAKIDADMTREEKEKFLEEIDERCPISDNVKNTTPCTFEVE
ncbi:MAG: OsmC family protein [Spirochaetes bacterium]|nr:OsmC family protein [Spirochaetota bacterium]